MTPEDEGKPSPARLRSQQAWLLGGLLALAILNSIFAGIAASQEVELSESTQMLWWFVFSILAAVWLKNDIVERGSETSRQYPHFVLFLFWPLLLPWHLVATRGLEGLVLYLGFVALYAAPYVVELGWLK